MILKQRDMLRLDHELYDKFYELGFIIKNEEKHEYRGVLMLDGDPDKFYNYPFPLIAIDLFIDGKHKNKKIDYYTYIQENPLEAIKYMMEIIKPIVLRYGILRIGICLPNSNFERTAKIKAEMYKKYPEAFVKDVGIMTNEVFCFDLDGDELSGVEWKSMEYDFKSNK